MPKQVIGAGPNHRTTYIRDDHDETGIVHSLTEVDDSELLEKNKRNRIEKTAPTGSGFALEDGGEVIYHFRVDPTLWAIFKRKHPDIISGMRSRDQLIRERAAAKLRELQPGWVVAAPGRHHH